MSNSKDTCPLKCPIGHLVGRLCSVFTLELGEDLVGVLGPGERLAALVPAVAEPTDRGHQLLDAGEVATAQGLALDDGEEHLDQVQPGAIGGREVQLDPGMAGQPGLDLGVLVGGVVVHHYMQLPTRIGLGDELEELQELAVAMAGMAGIGDLPGGHLQGGNRVVVPWRR